MGLFEHFPYTNFHELNADWLLRKTKELLARMADAEARLSAAEARLDNAEGRLDTVETDITAIKTEISAIKSRLSTLETRITAAETRLDGVVADISSLNSRVTITENNVINILSRLSAAESTIAAIAARETIPAHTSADNGKILTVSNNNLVWGVSAGGGLPAITSGDGGKVLVVNANEDGVEWSGSAGLGVRYIDFTDVNHVPNLLPYAADMLAGHPFFLRVEYSAGDGDIVTIVSDTLLPMVNFKIFYDYSTGTNIEYISAEFLDSKSEIAQFLNSDYPEMPFIIEINNDITGGSSFFNAISLEPIVDFEDSGRSLFTNVFNATITSIQTYRAGKNFSVSLQFNVTNSQGGYMSFDSRFAPQANQSAPFTFIPITNITSHNSYYMTVKDDSVHGVIIDLDQLPTGSYVANFNYLATV